MELTYDWHRFQAVFGASRRAATQQMEETGGPVFAVIDEGRVVSLYCSGEDLTCWIGASYREMVAQVTHREVVVFERGDVDHWLHQALELPHYYDQLEMLRTKSRPQVVSRSRFRKSAKALLLKQSGDCAGNQHFLLEGLRGPGARFLPAAFGFYVCLEGEVSGESRSLLLVIRRGKIESFCTPEFSGLSRERASQPEDVVKYLSEKFLVPVQGLFVPATLWREWADAGRPWYRMSRALRLKQARLVPFRWGVATYIFLRGIIGI